MNPANFPDVISLSEATFQVGCTLKPASEQNLEIVRQVLLDHELYRAVDSIEKLRLFMEDHVFAVWDFMTLVKRLQCDLTCMELPWQPPKDTQSARFINEVVLGEETDEGPDGKPISHLALYLEGMREVGANTKPFDRFLELVSDGMDVSLALSRVAVPDHVARFVQRTIHRAMLGDTVEVIADFLYGREDVIPDMFQRFLDRWEGRPEKITAFRYYLERHIELDGDSHGPAAHRMLALAVGDDKLKAERGQQAAIEAMSARIALWTGTLERLRQGVSR